MIGLGLRSAAVMRRVHHLDRFGRVSEMLSSQTSPPVSIVIPAYNEAAGIVDSVRSMSIVGYPRFEIVIINDGSTDGTLAALIEAFSLEKVRIPYRPDIATAPLRAIYRGHGPFDITLIDKENGRAGRRPQRRDQRRQIPIRSLHRRRCHPRCQLSDRCHAAGCRGSATDYRGRGEHPATQREQGPARTSRRGGRTQETRGADGRCWSICAPSSPAGRLGRRWGHFPSSPEHSVSGSGAL